MADKAAEQELYRACRVLFGRELDISADFLQYLQISGVKSAYRRKALETHPDLASSHGIISPQTFASTRQAYDKLIDYLAGREKGFGMVGNSSASIHVHAERPVAPAENCPRMKRPGPGSRVRKSFPHPAHAGTLVRMDIDALYQGPLPLRNLLFGHFLYYSGRINWRTIAHALIWQRVNRPRLGEIGRRFGWLNEDDVVRVINNELQQPFGASAVMMGLLSESQLNLLVFQQKSLQKRFGQYFIINELFSPRSLAGFLIEHIRHNRQFADSH